MNWHTSSGDNRRCAFFLAFWVVAGLLWGRLESRAEDMPGVIEIPALAYGFSSTIGATNVPGSLFVGRWYISSNICHSWFIFDVPMFTSRLARVELSLFTFNSSETVISSPAFLAGNVAALSTQPASQSVPHRGKISLFAYGYSFYPVTS